MSRVPNSARRLRRTAARFAVRAAARYAASAVGWKVALPVVGLVVSVATALTVLVSIAAGVAALAAQPRPPEDVIGIPGVVVDAYMNASATVESQYGCRLTPWLLAGIGYVETRHGSFGGSSVDPATGVVTPPIYGPRLDGSNNTKEIRDTDNGRLDGDRQFDRAVGPMQFIPQTWKATAAVGVDGNGDGVEDPQNVWDAALAAAHYLCRGKGLDLTVEPARSEAVFRYNHSQEYVAEVLKHAKRYQRVFERYRREDGDGRGTAAKLLAHPNFSAPERAVNDLTDGLIDQRAIDLMLVLADKYAFYVGVLKTGHYQCVGGGYWPDKPSCRESHHWHGRGIDISVIDGEPVRVTSQAALEMVTDLTVLNPDWGFLPSEVGSPFSQFESLPGFFTDGDHQDHIHLGFCGTRRVGDRIVNTCEGA